MLPLKKTLAMVSAAAAIALSLAPGAARADLTEELCGKLAKGDESVQSEGVKTTIHIDTVEGRTSPVAHCYIHGTLAEDTRFRILLPQAWNDRLVIGLGGGFGGDEFSNDAGATVPLVSVGHAWAQVNEGRVEPVFDASDSFQELHYIRTHQIAQFAKGRVQQRYGKQPDRTYLFGSSGGGWRSLSQIERYPQTYDGAAIRNPNIDVRNFVYTLSVFDHFYPVIKPKINQIVQARDRYEDPLPLLTPAEQAALLRIYNAGSTRGSEFKYPAIEPSTVAIGVIGTGYVMFRLFDPTYFDDFWNVPGYAGKDGEVSAQVVEGVTGSATAVGASNANGDVLNFVDGSKAFGVNAIKGWRVTFTTGLLAGTSFHVATNTATGIVVDGYSGALNGLAAGDQYQLSNRDFLAWQHYHQHIAQCAYPEYAGECSGGTPLKVQRPRAVQQALETRSATFGGRLRKPVVAVNQALDHLVWPPVAYRYFNLAREVLGPKANEMLRVYLSENTFHGNPNATELDRAVERDSSWLLTFQLLTRWVESGVAPPPDTVATVTPGLITFPADAANRKGIQPTVRGTANGQLRIVVPAGSTVALDGIAQSPIGKIVRYDWDFEGNSSYDCSSSAATGLPLCAAGFVAGASVTTPALHLYPTPGTYTATLRVHDDTDNPLAFDGLENLVRVVIVVQ
jgi:hypothetical protein